MLLASTDWPVIKRFRKAQLLNTMTTNFARVSATMNALTRGIVTVVMVLAYLLSAFVVSSLHGAVLWVLSGLGLASAAIWMRRSYALGHRLNTANRGVMRETICFLDSMKAAKAARAEVALTQRFDASIAESRAINVTFVEQQGRLRNSVQLIASIAALLTLLVGYGVISLGGGELLVMAAMVLRIAPIVLRHLAGCRQSPTPCRVVSTTNCSMAARGFRAGSRKGFGSPVPCCDRPAC